MNFTTKDRMVIGESKNRMQQTTTQSNQKAKRETDESKD